MLSSRTWQRKEIDLLLHCTVDMNGESYVVIITYLCFTLRGSNDDLCMAQNLEIKEYGTSKAHDCKSNDTKNY